MPDPHAAVRSEEALKARAEAVTKRHNAAVRSERRAGAGKSMAILALGTGLGWTVYNNNRLAEKAAGREVVYSVLQANGEFIASDHYTDVTPVSVQADQVTDALWRYVTARDCYGMESFIRQAYMAQAMSDGAVGRQLHAQLALSNPVAPQHVYGEHGITVHCEPIDPPAAIGDSGDQYLFRFRRWEDDGHGIAINIAAAPVYSVTVRFRTGVYPSPADDKRRAWLDRVTFNPPGVQVIDYPGAKPENVRPVKRETAAVQEARP